MSDEAAFLEAIKAAPNDDTVRLVYADWLDEHDQRGGEFLRIDCEIAALEQRIQFHAKLAKEAVEAGVIDLSPPDRLNCLDRYSSQRADLLAKLRVVSCDLEDDWMAAVSRVPIAEINARTWQIQSWLRRQVTVEEMLGVVNRVRPAHIPKGLWARLLGLCKRTPVEASISQSESPYGLKMRAWVEANIQQGDELWECDSAGESWDDLYFLKGYAIVRQGKVVEFEIVEAVMLQP